MTNSKILIARGGIALFSLFGLLLALFVSLWIHGRMSSDGKAVYAAQQILDKAGSDDLVLVSSKMGRGAEDRGRILFPFRPLAAIADDTEIMDLFSLPFRRVLVQKGVDLAKWNIDPAQLEPMSGARGWKILNLGDPDRLLLNLWDANGVRIEAATDPVQMVSAAVQHRPARSLVKRCQRPSPQGGVSCGSEAWFRVGPSVQKLGGLSRLCLWAHPPKEAKHLIIPVKIPQKFAGDGVLKVQLNFADRVRPEAHHAPVLLRVGDPKNQREMAQISCKNSQGTCVLGVKLDNNINVLELDITTTNNGRQLLCLTGEILGR